MPEKPDDVKFVRVNEDELRRWAGGILEVKSMLNRGRNHPYLQGMSKQEAKDYVQQELFNLMWSMYAVAGHPF